MSNAADPTHEIAELRAWLAQREAELAVARAELTGARLQIEQYKAQLAKLRRMQFGRSSEKIDAEIGQLELILEDLEEGEAARRASATQHAPSQSRRDRRQAVRRPLPDHLPREAVVHHPGSACPGCGGTRFSKIGEDVTEVLEKIPARLKVIRHIRPKLSCRCCERIVQAPMPTCRSRRAGRVPASSPMWWSASISTGCHSIASRRSWRAKGSRSTSHPGRLGRACRLVGDAAGRADRCRDQGGTGPPHRRHAGRGAGAGHGKTRTGRLWAYGVDERPWQGSRRPLTASARIAGASGRAIISPASTA